MGKARLWAAARLERLRQSLWFIPGLMVIAAGGLAATLAAGGGAAPDIGIVDFALPSTIDGARAVLQVLSASVMTVTSVVFSLTVVALQITAGNYSPRVLRNFLRKPGTQIVLGTFLATFTYCYIILQNASPSAGPGEPSWGPQTAFLVVPAFAVGSIIALVYFIHHVTQAIRVDLILGEVLDETLATIRKVHHSDDPGPGSSQDAPPAAAKVMAPASGFVQAYGTKDLVNALCRENLFSAYLPTAGDHVLEGTVLALVWGEDSTRPGSVPDRAIVDAIHLGDERTMQQDVAFGLRQLTDVAIRALSPGVNDPNTAVTTIVHLAVAYQLLATRSIGPRAECDSHGISRVFVPRPSFGEYLHIAVQQIAHYGKEDIMVMLRLMQMLADLKSVAREENHPAINSAIARVVEEGQVGLALESDRAALRDASERAFEGVTTPHHRTAAG